MPRAKKQVKARLTPKAELLAVLTAMPEEAFAWLQNGIVNGPIWPDGTGGFSRESALSIAAAVKAARRAFPKITYPTSTAKLPTVIVPKE